MLQEVLDVHKVHDFHFSLLDFCLFSLKVMQAQGWEAEETRLKHQIEIQDKRLSLLDHLYLLLIPPLTKTLTWLLLVLTSSLLSWKLSFFR